MSSGVENLSDKRMLIETSELLPEETSHQIIEAAYPLIN